MRDKMIMRHVKKPYRKILSADLGLLHFVGYYPNGIGIDQYAGQSVRVIAHYGPFRAIQTEDGRKFYGVGKGLLLNISK
jgi:hypothetical protein